MGDRLWRCSALYTCRSDFGRPVVLHLPLPGRDPTRLAGIANCSEHRTSADERNSNLILHTTSGWPTGLLRSLQPIDHYNHCFVDGPSDSIFEQFYYGPGGFFCREADRYNV